MNATTLARSMAIIVAVARENQNEWTANQSKFINVMQ